MPEAWEKGGATITDFSRAFLALLGMAILVVFLQGVCLAQELSFSIDHYSDFIVIGPGETSAGEFVLTNRSQQPLTVEIRLVDFYLGPDGGVSTLDPGTLGDRSLANFITYAPEQMTIAAGEAQQVRYSFTLPQGADGPHWACLLVVPEMPEATVDPQEEEHIGFVVHLQINYAITIIQCPRNSPKPEGQIVTMDVRGSRQDEKNALTVEGTFQNVSEAVLQCQVYIECRGPMGETVFRYDFQPDRLVLPQAERIFSHTFEEVDMPSGQYLILCVVDFGGDYLTAGQYQVTVK